MKTCTKYIFICVESDKESIKEEENQENDEEFTSNESESEESDNEIGEEESQTQTDNETDIGLKSLLEDVSMEKSSDDKVRYTCMIKYTKINKIYNKIIGYSPCIDCRNGSFRCSQ